MMRRQPRTMYGLDVSEFRIAVEKAARLREAEITGIEQARKLENPDARVALDDISAKARLDGKYLREHRRA